MQTRSWEEPRGAERRNCGGKTPVYHEEEDEREDRSERTCRIGHGRHARNWARRCGSVFGCGCFGLGVRPLGASGFADGRRAVCALYFVQRARFWRCRKDDQADCQRERSFGCACEQCRRCTECRCGDGIAALYCFDHRSEPDGGNSLRAACECADAATGDRRRDCEYRFGERQASVPWYGGLWCGQGGSAQYYAFACGGVGAQSSPQLRDGWAD